MPNNVDSLSGSTETREALAENFVNDYLDNSNNIFLKVFSDKLKNYLVSDGIKDNIGDALNGLLIKVVSPHTYEVFSKAKDIISSGGTPDLGGIEAALADDLVNDDDVDDVVDDVVDDDMMDTSNLINKAKQLLTTYKNIPYTRGGKNPKTGLDCSGFINNLNSVLGSSSREQFLKCRSTSKYDGNNAKPGDLVFWDSTLPSPKWRSEIDIPEITDSSGTKHFINHVALIKKCNTDGSIEVYQSTPSKGVHIATIDPITAKNGRLKNDLYIGTPA